MELDDMKLAWQDLNRRLDEQRLLNRQLFRESRLGRLRRGLLPLFAGQSIQLLLGILISGWAAAFWIPRVHVPHLLACGLLVQAYGLMLMLMGTRVLFLTQRIDLSAPVLAIQRRLAELRAWRVRVEAPVNAAVGCFIWIPMLGMGLAWYGIDIWKPGMIPLALLDGFVGLALVALTVYVVRRLGLGGRLADHVAGSSVRKAEAALDEITRFERE